jgi:hypothetical protein
MVRQFAADFSAVTARWVAEGWHSTDEVEAWRQEIRKIMQSANSANSDIADLCGVWREMAKKLGV